MCQILSAQAAIDTAYGNVNIVAVMAAPSATAMEVEMLKTSVTELEKGAKDVTLVAAKFSNSGTQDLIVSEIYIQGSFSALNETETDLYVGAARFGEPSVVQDNAVGYTGMSLLIKAGGSETFTLHGDIPVTNSKTPMTYYFTENIVARNAAGIRAKVSMIGNASASVLQIREKGATTSSSFNINFVTEGLTVSQGDKYIKLQKITLKNDLDRVAVVRINGFDMISSGSYMADENLDSAYLFLGDKLLGVGSVTNNRMAFDTVVALSAGSSEVLTLKGDIAEKASAKSISFNMDWDYNVLYGGVTVHTPVNLTGTPSIVKFVPTAINPAIEYDIAASFTVADHPYIEGANKIFSKVVRDGEVLQGSFDGGEDDTPAKTGRYCAGEGRNYDKPNGWTIERKFVEANTYRVTVSGQAKPGCGLGRSRNTGWFKLNPLAGWKITDEVRCTVLQDMNASAAAIETYCTVNKDTGEVKWQSGSQCGECCSCGGGAAVDIEVIVKKIYDDKDGAVADTTVTTNCKNADPAIKDGSMIRLRGGIDIYIAKIANCKKFKRLILSPSVFRSYGHLKWGDVIEVDQETLDAYTVSKYVKVAEENAYWELSPDGDNGLRRKLMKTYRWDAAISGWLYLFDMDGTYMINATDRDSYLQGEDIN